MMTPATISTDSLLVVEVGSVNTRAILFDVVDDRYRFLGSGSARTTAVAPYHNISEGVHQAIDQLQKTTERVLLGADAQLLIPTAADGSGVDRFAAVISVGKPLQVVVVGLLENVSVESAKRVALSTYSNIAQIISLNDRRKQDARINSIVRLRPDLILIAGGAEDGASASLMKLLEPIGLACYLMPLESRPEILFAGNQAMHDEVQTALSGIAHLHFAPNIRPTLEFEQLGPAQAEMAKLTTQIRLRKLAGVNTLHTWANGGVMPSGAAFGRVIRFLSKVHPNRKGVLGVDLGASAVTLASAFGEQSSLTVLPHSGMASGSLNVFSPAELVRWLPFQLSEGQAQDFIANRGLFPASMPASSEELFMEQALARLALQNVVKSALPGFPSETVRLHEGLLPLVEPLLATGSVLTHAPTLVQSTIMLLDGLQPVGVTTLVLDQNHLLPSLGMAAAINPLLAVQVLDSNSLLHLGTVISPVCSVRSGTPVLRLKITYDSGQESALEVKQGAIEVLPLPPGQSARLQLQPLHRCDIGMGASGRGGTLRVMGGAMGVIIDARGRPIVLSNDHIRRQELHKKWLWTLGGQ